MLYVYASISRDRPNQAACAISCVNQHLCNTLPVNRHTQTRHWHSLRWKSANVVVSKAEPPGWGREPNESFPPLTVETQLKVAPAYFFKFDFFFFFFYPAVEQEVFLVQGLCLFVSEFDWIRYLQHAAVYSVWHTKAICREMIPLWHLGEEYESIMPKCCSCLSSCGTKQGFSQGFRGEGAVVGIMVSGSQQNTRNSWERALI